MTSLIAVGNDAAPTEDVAAALADVAHAWATSASAAGSVRHGIPPLRQPVTPRLQAVAPTHAGRSSDAEPIRIPRRMVGQRPPLLCADALATAVGMAAIFSLLDISNRPFVVALTVMLTLVSCRLCGAYGREGVRVSASTLDEAPTLVVASGLVALLLAIILPLNGAHNLSGSGVALAWLGLSALLAAARSASRFVTRRVSRAERCVVIGDGNQIAELRERFDASNARVEVVGSVPLTRELMLESEESLQAVLHEAMVMMNAERVVVAPLRDALDHLSKLIRVAKSLGVRVNLMPAGLEAVGHTMELDDVNGMMLIGVRPYHLTRTETMLKRVLDLVVASLLTLMMLPLLALIALAVKLDSSGPVFFRQTRVGRDGRHFQIIKFRSMVIDAEALKGDLRGLNEVGDGMFKITDDPRVTRVGRILRRTSLDELPQLFNVLAGKMSLVGPRPLIVDEDSSIAWLDRERRLDLTPGMTGPWQVLRKRVSIDEMIALDYGYVAGWSTWADIKIMTRTALYMVRRGNV